MMKISRRDVWLLSLFGIQILLCLVLAAVGPGIDWSRGYLKGLLFVVEALLSIRILYYMFLYPGMHRTQESRMPERSEIPGLLLGVCVAGVIFWALRMLAMEPFFQQVQLPAAVQRWTEVSVFGVLCWCVTRLSVLFKGSSGQNMSA